MKKKILLLFLLAGAFLLFTSPSYATIITYDLNFEYSGGTPPAGPTPWLTAVFDDGDTEGSVMLTMSASGLTDEEFVSRWVFNYYDPTFPGEPVGDLDFTWFSGRQDNILGQTEDSYKAGPAHGFDIVFEFPTAETFRFGAGDTSVYNISGDGLWASKFDVFNSSGVGPFTTAAHVQGIGPDGEDSGWIAPNPNPVPEPATMLLVGIGLIGLAGFGCRRFKA